MAEKLVKTIAESNGHLGESIYATMSTETRRKVQDAMFAHVKDKETANAARLCD